MWFVNAQVVNMCFGYDRSRHSNERERGAGNGAR